MKNVKSIFRIQIFMAILICIANPLFAKENEVKDRFEKTFKISESDKLVLNMYESDLQINTWSNNEIKLTGEILISGGEKEDVDKILNAFKNPEVEQGMGKIDINTNFTDGSTVILGFYKRTKLSTGESVSVSSFKATYAIWVPQSIAFKLMSKYNNVKAPDLLGKLDFQLYNLNLDMGDFGNNSSFDAKYSTIHIGKGQDVKFDIYDCKLNTDELKKVIISSKYSTFNSKAINLLALKSYTDNYTIDNLNGIDIDAKYTTLKARGNSNIGKFNLYDCNIDVEDFTKIEYDSKYSEFKGNKAEIFTINTSYNDTYELNEINDFSCRDSKYSKFTANKVGSCAMNTSYNDTYEFKEVNDFSCQESKYNTVNIGFAQTSINLLNTYDSNYKIERVGANFTSFKGDFKYGSVNLVMEPAMNYKLIFNSTYGEINYPKEKFTKKPLIYIEKDGKAQFESSTDPSAKCEINFTAYDLNFTIE